MIEKIIHSIWRNQHQKIITVVLFSSLFSFLMFIYAPIDMLMSNKNAFWFELSEMAWPCVCQFLIVNAINISILSIALALNTALFNVLFIIENIVFILLYLHGTFMLWDLEAITGQSSEIKPLSKGISIVVLMVIIVFIVYLVSHFGVKRYFQYVKPFSIIAITVLVLSVIIEIILGGKKEDTTYVITTENLSKHSSNQNIIVILMDYVSSDTFFEALKEYEDTNNTQLFKDFNYYSNTCGKYTWTAFAVPHILTGRGYLFEEQYDQYIYDSFKNSYLVQLLKDNNYEIDIYDADIGTTYKVSEETYEDIGNAQKLKTRFSSNFEFCKMMDYLVGYRYLPYFLKEKIDLTYIDFYSLRIADEQEVYKWDDLAFYEYNNTHTIKKTNKSQFKFIHLEGGHCDYNFDRNLQPLPKELQYDFAAGREKLIGCCKILDSYFEDLKDAGIYDDSTIIVMSDHGMRQKENGDWSLLERALDPIFIVKDS